MSWSLVKWRFLSPLKLLKVRRIVIESQKDCSGREEEILLLFRRECRAPRDHKDTHQRWFPVFSRFWLWCIGMDLASARRNINWTKFCHYKSQGHRSMDIKGTLAIGMDSMENVKWFTHMKYNYPGIDVIFASSKLSKMIDKPSFGKGKKCTCKPIFLTQIGYIYLPFLWKLLCLLDSWVEKLNYTSCLGGVWKVESALDSSKQIMVLQGYLFSCSYS